MNITQTDEIVLASQILGYIGGAFVVSLNIPLVVKVVKEKSSKSLSIPYLILNFFTGIIFITYGVLINQWPIIGNNIVYNIIVIILIILKVYYDKKNKEGKIDKIENNKT